MDDDRVTGGVIESVATTCRPGNGTVDRLRDESHEHELSEELLAELEGLKRTAWLPVTVEKDEKAA